MHHSAESTHASLYDANVLVPTGTEEYVRMARLDTLWQRGEIPERIDYIKVDAQGAEGGILAGATKLLAEGRAAWWIELWSAGLANAGTELSDLVEAFEAAGYQPAGMTWATAVEHAAAHQGHSSMDILVLPPVREN